MKGCLCNQHEISNFFLGKIRKHTYMEIMENLYQVVRDMGYTQGHFFKSCPLRASYNNVSQKFPISIYTEGVSLLLSITRGHFSFHICIVIGFRPRQYIVETILPKGISFTQGVSPSFYNLRPFLLSYMYRIRVSPSSIYRRVNSS